MKAEKIEKCLPKDHDTAADLICRLEMQGFKAAVVPVQHLSELRESFMKLNPQNLYADEFYREYLASFAFHPPA